MSTESVVLSRNPGGTVGNGAGNRFGNRHESVIVTDEFNLSRERTYLINITEVPS